MSSAKKTAQTPEKETETKPAEAKPHAPPRFLSWLARRPKLVLALLCLLLWTPGILSLPALDRDESRFAESSRQMLDSGNVVDIRFGQVPRYKKPIGIYWLQAAATAAAGRAYGSDGDESHIWTYRLPSLIGGIAAAWLMVWVAAPLGAEAGLLAALLLVSTILLTAEASIATTDAVLLASVLGMQGVLLRLYQGPRPDERSEDGQSNKVSRRTALWGWAALAIGILIKGPVAPGVALATIVALGAWDWRAKRRQAFAWLKGAEPLWGVVLLLVLVLPWLIAIAIESHGAFFTQSLGDDFAAKVAGAQESHGAWPGYYLLLSSISLWPAVLFVLPAIGFALTQRGEPAIRFLLAWAGGWWLLVEIVPTYLPHYVLPAYPALTLLAALWLLAPKEAPAIAAAAPPPDAKDAKSKGEDEEVPAAPPPAPRRDWKQVLVWIALLQFALGLAALATAPVLLPRLYGGGDDPILWGAPISVWLMGGTAVLALTGLVALILFACGARLGALIPALLAAWVVIPLLTVMVAPRLDQFWVSDHLKALVAKDAIAGDPPPVLAGYEEPSLVFALGADTGLSDGKGAADLGARQGGLALIEDNERNAFLARLAELQADATALDDVSGFNYSRGKRVHVTVYRVTDLDPLLHPRPQ